MGYKLKTEDVVRNLSIKDMAIIEFFEKGGRVEVVGQQAIVISRYDRVIKQQLRYSTSKSRQPYYKIQYKYNRRKSVQLSVHRMIAYKKYGYALFGKGLQVRHLDDNSLNNSIDNIAIGTAKDNYRDRTEESKRITRHRLIVSHLIRRINKSMKEIVMNNDTTMTNERWEEMVKSNENIINKLKQIQDLLYDIVEPTIITKDK